MACSAEAGIQPPPRAPLECPAPARTRAATAFSADLLQAEVGSQPLRAPLEWSAL